MNQSSQYSSQSSYSSNPQGSSGKNLAVTIGVVVCIFVGMALFINYLVNKPKTVYLHNPYQEDLMVKVDEEFIVVLSQNTIELEIEEGSHHFISSLGDSTLLDTTLSITNSFLKSGGVVNMSNQKMYLLTETYGPTNSLFNNQINEQNMKVVIVDTTIMMGNMSEIPANKILIPKTWDYGLDQYFPETIEVRQGSSTFGKNMTKIYDKPGILDYWNDIMAELEAEELGY